MLVWVGHSCPTRIGSSWGSSRRLRPIYQAAAHKTCATLGHKLLLAKRAPDPGAPSFAKTGLAFDALPRLTSSPNLDF
jgi:hypothetical protein